MSCRMSLGKYLAIRANAGIRGRNLICDTIGDICGLTMGDSVRGRSAVEANERRGKSQREKMVQGTNNKKKNSL